MKKLQSFFKNVNMYEGKQKTDTMLELQGDGSNLGKCKKMLLVYVKSSEVPLLWNLKQLN